MCVSPVSEIGSKMQIVIFLVLFCLDCDCDVFREEEEGEMQILIFFLVLFQLDCGFVSEKRRRVECRL